jgi:hypothetical protein
MADQEQDQPRIIVDSDWKSQAQAEKEKLAAKETEQGGQAQEEGAGELPEPSFQGLVHMLAMQAITYMGGVADPKTGKAIFDPMYARHVIDLLGVLEEKTKNNLSQEETKELGGILQELRSRYVELVQLVAKQQAQGEAGAGGDQPPGTPPMGGPSMT